MEIIYTTLDGKSYGFGNNIVLGFYIRNYVTDRTSQDVARWKMLHDKGWEAMTAEEQAEWVAGMKGSYNYTDMNRVENAVRELEARFLGRGIKLALTTKVDWTRTSWPTKADMNRYFSNVAAIKKAAVVDLNTPAVPTTGTLFNYTKANDIEKILEAVDTWLNRSDTIQMYSGDLYLGEV